MKKTRIGCWLVAALCACGVQGAEDWSRIYLGAQPSVTGDGQQFVFEWNARIWLAPTAGGTARCLTPGNEKCMNPLISSDGRRVVFNSSREGCENHLFELDLASGGVRQLSYHSEQTNPITWGVGETNVMCVVQRDHAGKHACRVATLPTQQAGEARVAFDMEAFSPSLSADGQQLLFTRRGTKVFRKRRHSVGPEAGEVWLYDMKKASFTPVVRDVADSRDPRWAPTKKGFYYLNASGGVCNLYYRELNEKAKAEKLTSFTGDHIIGWTISADGKTAVFRQKFDFYRLALDQPGAKPERIILHPASGSPARATTRRRSYTTCWNNDAEGEVAFCDKGAQIAFTAGGDLWVMDTVLREPRLVHGSSLTHERACAFSPDGKILYYTSDRGEGTDIWKAERADPSKPWWENRSFKKTQITHDNEIRRLFTLSPDGTSFAWQNFTGRLAFAGTNGVVRARGPLSSREGHYSWAPDGKYVAAQVTSDDGQREVAIVSTQKDATFWLLTKNFQYDGWPTWSPDGAIIAWVSNRADIDAANVILSYVYLDNAVEERELLYAKIDQARTTSGAKARAASAEKRPVPFEKLIDHVRTTRIVGDYPCFAGDSRTLAFRAENATKSICLPNEMNPKLVSSKRGIVIDWIKKNTEDAGKILWMVDSKPAHGDTVFDFRVYQTTDVADYQELAFLSAWGRMKNFYYDPNCHGADWAAVREKYLAPARNAASPKVFGRIIQMMLGELDTSHVNFTSTTASQNEWEPSASAHAWNAPTAHLGLRFDDTYAGKGLKIRDVIKNSPADKREFGFKPGDIVEAVDGVAVKGLGDLARVLNGPAGRMVTLTVKGRELRLSTITYEAARNLVGEAQLDAARERVHAKSKNRFGYLNIDAMNRTSLVRFQYEAYAEGYGRDGLVIDVRTNHGGNTADQILTTLFGVRNGCAVTRDGRQGYIVDWCKQPVWAKPIVVLCSEESGSNAEMFSHTIKHEKRGKLVGRQTGGNVICTFNMPLLDYGEFRNPYLGIFLLDGRDMEYNGAIPDVVVDNQPAQLVKGIDEQLEKAIDVLAEEVAAWKKANPPIRPIYAK